MLYVSGYDGMKNQFAVTDTSDGVVEWHSAQYILSVNPVTGFAIHGVDSASGSIRVVNVSSKINQVGFGRIKNRVASLVEKWDEDAIMNVARTAHFVKKVKGLALVDMRKEAVNQIYPVSIEAVVNSAQQYTNNVHEVNVTDLEQVKNALRNNVCLVLQHKTNGVLSAFICTGSLAVVDKIYGRGFFDGLYLTKRLYKYTYNIDKVRPKIQESKEKNPNMLNVFSCSLRFRNAGIHHNKPNKELSSPFYTVNLERLFGMYVLDNPSTLGNTIIPDIMANGSNGVYDFDFNMYAEVNACVSCGANNFRNNQKFMWYVDSSKASSCKVPIDSVIDMFDDDFNYMMYLRKTGYSFK